MYCCYIEFLYLFIFCTKTSGFVKHLRIFLYFRHFVYFFLVLLFFMFSPPPLCCPGSLALCWREMGWMASGLSWWFQKHRSSCCYEVQHLPWVFCKHYQIKEGSSLFFLLPGVSNRERLSRFLRSHFLYLLADLWPHSNAVLNICEDVCSVSKVVPALFYWAWLLEGSGNKNTALSHMSYLQWSSIKYHTATADSFTVYTTVYF